MDGNNVEILVHTTAPSRGRDDAGYRAFAHAYLNFQPASCRRVDLERAPNLFNKSDSDAAAPKSQERESEASYKPDTYNGSQDSQGLPQTQIAEDESAALFMYSPNLSFSSVWDNRDSPCLRHAIDPVSSQYHMSSTPPSFIVDSQPETDKVETKEIVSPTTALRLYLPNGLGVSDGSLDQRRGLGMSNYRSLSTSTQEVSSAAGQILETSSKVVTQNRIVTTGTERNSVESGPGVDGVGLVSRIIPSTRDFDLLNIKRGVRPHKRQRLEPITSMKVHALSQAATVMSTAKLNSPQSADTASVFSLWSCVNEIRSRPPITSEEILNADSLFTKDLFDIAERMSLADQYCPRKQLRDIRPMERGYWLINAESWGEGLRNRCWDCLGNLVNRGSLGWGVWCVKDISWQDFRVYCWGAIIGHIYLVLHMASEGKIRGARPSWITGDGTPLITMES